MPPLWLKFTTQLYSASFSSTLSLSFFLLFSCHLLYPLCTFFFPLAGSIRILATSKSRPASQTLPRIRPGHERNTCMIRSWEQLQEYLMENNSGFRNLQRFSRKFINCQIIPLSPLTHLTFFALTHCHARHTLVEYFHIKQRTSL